MTEPQRGEQVFALAGLRLVEDAEGTVRVDEDRDSGRLWRAIASGR